VDQLLTSFRKLGLTNFEAKAYLSLLGSGNVTGYELSKQSGIPSSKVYSVLQNLLEKGLIISLESHPVRYLPRPADEAVEKCSSELKATLTFLKRNLKKIQHPSLDEQILTKNIIEKEEIFRKARQIINETKEDLYLALWQEEWHQLRASLKKAHAKGIRIFTVAYGPVPIGFGEIYQHAASDSVFRERKERRLVLVSDDEKALFASFSGGKREKGVLTEDGGLVYLVRDFIIHEIYIVKIQRAFPEEIARAFGPDWQGIRLQNSTSESKTKRLGKKRGFSDEKRPVLEASMESKLTRS
jgi:HTH-type transcriptional regulator, sugar sensing transcriptional regulator